MRERSSSRPPSHIAVLFTMSIFLPRIRHSGQTFRAQGIHSKAATSSSNPIGSGKPKIWFLEKTYARKAASSRNKMHNSSGLVEVRGLPISLSLTWTILSAYCSMANHVETEVAAPNL